MRKKAIYFICLSVIGLLIWFFTWCTPYYSDDWNYDLIFHLKQPIHSFRDVVVSQYYHYLYQNGRMVPHLIIQTFDGLLGKSWFNVCNALMMVLLLHLLVVRVSIQSPYSGKVEIPAPSRRTLPTWAIASLSFFLLFFLINGFKESFLWMSGSVNYAWVAVLLLGFDLLVIRGHFKRRYDILLLICGILCGWTHEGIVIGMSAGYVVYYFFHKKELTRSRLFLLTGFFIGTLLVVFSPSNLHRHDISWKHLDYADNLVESLWMMNNVRALPILLIMLLILLIMRKVRMRTYLRQNAMELTAIAVTFLFIFATHCVANRSRFGFEFFCVVLILSQLVRLSPSVLRGSAITADAILLVMVALLVPHLLFNREETKKALAQLENHAAPVIVEWKELPTYANSYVLQLQKTNHRNTYLSHHFGYKRAVIVPRRFVDAVVRDSSQYRHFNSEPDLPFFAKRQEGSKPTFAKITLKPTDYRRLPFYIRPIAPYLDEYRSTNFFGMIDTTVIAGHPYVLIWKYRGHGIETLKSLEERKLSIQIAH